MIWHYTTGDRLPAILRSGRIYPSTHSLSAGGEIGRRAVWFSTRNDWEPAAGRHPGVERIATLLEAGKVTPEHALAMYRDLSRHAAGHMRGAYGGLVRIGVAPETAPLRWADFLRLGGMPSPYAETLEQIDRAAGADPTHWRMTLRAVPRSRWLAIEALDGRRWVPVSAS